MVPVARQLAQIDFEGLGKKLGGLTKGTGQLAEKLIQSTVMIAGTGTLAGGQGQVRTAHVAKESFKKVVLQQVLGDFPFRVAGLDHFIEVAAGTAGGEDERRHERLGPDRDGTP